MIRINLIPSEGAMQARVEGVRIAQAALLAVLLVGSVSWGALEVSRARIDAALQRSQDALAGVQTTLQAVAQAEALLAQRHAQVMALNALRQRQSAPARLLEHVTASVPADAWLLELRFATGDGRRTLTIDGRALNFDAVGTCVSALRAGHADLQVDVVQAAAETVGETSVVRFLLRITTGEVAA